MDIPAFTDNYIKPSKPFLNDAFRLPLPAHKFEHQADFIVQSRCGSTVSTNLITKYRHPASGVRMVEVYKNSQNSETGVFVRLVGTMALVKNGWPCLFLDAAAANVNPRSAALEPLNTRAAVHMPGAADTARTLLFDTLSERCTEASFKGAAAIDIAALPPFWGSLWFVRKEGFALDMIALLRTAVWDWYAQHCLDTPAQADIDYTRVQHQMIFKNSAAEYQSFLNMGLAVPVEAQAAFFSVLVTGLDGPED
jgi:hypothetical protein